MPPGVSLTDQQVQVGMLTVGRAAARSDGEALMPRSAFATTRRWCAGLIGACLAVVVLCGLAVLVSPAARADGPEKVVIGAFINDLQDIDLANDSYTVDLYLWMRWRNPALNPWQTVDVMNSNGTQNTTSSSTGGVVGEPLFEEPRDMPDGSKYMIMRYQGVFSRKMNLEKYPFDVQNLELIFEDQGMDARQLQFVADSTPVRISRAVTNPGYLLEPPTTAVVNHLYRTNFGDLTAPAEVEYSRFIITIPVKRQILPYLVKIMLPIFIVILITWLIYVLPARLEDSRTGIGVTAMLTIVALQWTTDDNLPSVEYLTMLDLIYILSLFYVLVAMGYTVIASRRNRHQVAEALTRSTDRTWSIVTLGVYAVLVALTMFLYLNHQHVDPPS